MLIRFVQRELASLTKSAIALVTCKRPLPRVRVNVLGQVLLQCEPHVANAALEGPLILRMRQLVVPPEGKLAGECASAASHIALEDAR